MSLVAIYYRQQARNIRKEILIILNVHISSRIFVIFYIFSNLKTGLIYFNLNKFLEDKSNLNNTDTKYVPSFLI